MLYGYQSCIGAVKVSVLLYVIPKCKIEVYNSKYECKNDLLLNGI